MDGVQNEGLPEDSDYLGTLDLVEVEKKVEELFKNRCQSCHGNNEPRNISDLESLKTMSTFFVAGKPEVSLIYQSLLPNARRLMPQGGALTADEKNLVRDWILLVGSKDETNEEDVYYTGQVETLLEAKCFNCHNQEIIDVAGDQMDRFNGNPMLNTYESVLNYTAQGSIEDSLVYELNFYNQGSHASGLEYESIEYQELSEDEFKLFKSWIEQGAVLNNQ